MGYLCIIKLEKQIMKKLFRVKNENSMLGGVCLGLSEYFDIDVTLVRILFAAAFFSPVPIVISYFIMWIIMPLSTNRLVESPSNY